MGPQAAGSKGHLEPAAQEPMGRLRPRPGQKEPAGQGLQLSLEVPPGWGGGKEQALCPHRGRPVLSAGPWRFLAAALPRARPRARSGPGTRASSASAAGSTAGMSVGARHGARPAAGCVHPVGSPRAPTEQGSGRDACVCSQGLGLDFAKGGAPAGSGRGAGQRLTWAAPHRTPGTGHGAQRPLWAVVANGAGSAEGEGSASPGGGAGRPSFTVVPSQAGSLDAGRQSLRTAAGQREAPLPPSCCHCLLSLSLGRQGN